MSLTRDEIDVRLRTLVEHARKGPAAGPGVEITDQTAFTDLKLDSLALMELAYDVEESFHLTITDEELAALKTVGQLVDLIEGKGLS
jgi:acyl carrier protein